MGTVVRDRLLMLFGSRQRVPHGNQLRHLCWSATPEVLLAKQIHVVGAVIVRDGQVLCAQRGGAGSLAGLWEFPGGKIEAGETPRVALQREIQEELRCDIAVGEFITTTSYEYEFGVVHLTTFYCELRQGEPTLTEHTDVRWLRPTDMAQLEWAPADVPAVDLVRAAVPANG